jgi:hypothetical protein
MQMNQSLEEQIKTERQVAQIAEEQAQKERASAQTRIQAAEARAQEAEAALAAAEAQLRKDYDALERRMKAERQELDERLRSTPQPDLARAARLRQRGEEFASTFSSQSERLHSAASALQTAAEVARRLSKSIKETATLPGIRATEPPAPAPAAPPPGAQTPSAMQLLEQLAGIRQAESPPPAPPTSRPLPETASSEIIKRLNFAASRADEMAGGLQDLAAELIKEGDASKQAAETAEHLATELEQAAQPTPTTLRARLPVRAAKNEGP